MTLEELRCIAVSVGERQGWDFSRVQDERDPVPWDYIDVVRRYLRPLDRILDIGTGGGEKFLALACHLGTGIGIDASTDMIKTALKNKVSSQANNVSFEVMDAKALRFANAEFDVVLNRHCTVDVGESCRVLRSGGFFVTQQVGARNTQNICALFGCGPGGEYEQNPSQGVTSLAEAFRQRRCRVVCTVEYDVRYWFLDVESLLFWLKAIPIPQDFDIKVHWRQVDQIITALGTPKGIETNEHRELLIVQKPFLRPS